MNRRDFLRRSTAIGIGLMLPAPVAAAAVDESEDLARLAELIEFRTERLCMKLEQMDKGLRMAEVAIRRFARALAKKYQEEDGNDVRRI